MESPWTTLQRLSDGCKKRIRIWFWPIRILCLFLSTVQMNPHWPGTCPATRFLSAARLLSPVSHGRCQYGDDRVSEMLPALARWVREESTIWDYAVNNTLKKSDNRQAENTSIQIFFGLFLYFLLEFQVRIHHSDSWNGEGWNENKPECVITGQNTGKRNNAGDYEKFSAEFVSLFPDSFTA